MSDALQTQLNYDFKRAALLRQAVTHTSFVHEQALGVEESNQRLEFLGDAVLELCISDMLYHKHQDMPEGDMTQLRANLVCEASLAKIARKLKLGSFLLLGQGEVKEKGREKDSILADALEAVLGAMFLDGGIEPVRNFVFSTFSPLADKPKQQPKDNKTTLQELLQRNSRETAVYEIISESGPSHQKQFTAIVKHLNKILGMGSGSSKKEAEQYAAAEALQSLGAAPKA